MRYFVHKKHSLSMTDELNVIRNSPRRMKNLLYFCSEILRSQKTFTQYDIQGTKDMNVPQTFLSVNSESAVADEESPSSLLKAFDQYDSLGITIFLINKMQ